MDIYDAGPAQIAPAKVAETAAGRGPLTASRIAHRVRAR